MPPRNISFYKNHYYHIFNRTFNKIPVFTHQQDCIRAIGLLNYYRFKNKLFSFSKLKRLPTKLRKKFLKKMRKRTNLLVDIVAYCLMPNHFHLLLKKRQENGIVNFLSNFQNGFAKYFNLRYHRKGPLFEGRFRAVLVINDNQLLHLSRYIHLNPYSSGIVKRIEDLGSDQYNSFQEYLSGNYKLCNPKIILDQFKNSQDYKKFVFDQADYQKDLEVSKHLIIE